METQREGGKRNMDGREGEERDEGTGRGRRAYM